MARSNDTIQITFRIPAHWKAQAEALADKLAAERGLPVSETDLLREAIAQGFGVLARDASERTKYRVTASDGRSATCIFWFGALEADAIAKATELAGEHVGGRWAHFRVYRGNEEQPIHEVTPNENLKQPTRKGRK